MATTTTPSRTTTTTRAFASKFFVIAFAFTWLFWGLQLLAAREVIPALPGLTVIGTLGPLVVAVRTTAKESGRVGLRSLLSRIVRWRVAPIWYGVAIVGPLVLTLAAIALHAALVVLTPQGRGLFLIRNMVDEMRVSGNLGHHTIELVMRLKGGEPAG